MLMPVFISGALPSVTFGSVGWNEGAGALTRTVTGLTFPNANARRYIFAQFGHRSASAASSVTIGGVAATFVHSSISNFRCETWAALVPTGTSGSVAVTHGTNNVLLGVATWAVVGVRSITPTDTGTDNDNGTTADVSLDIAARGLGLGVCFATSATAVPGAATWAGFTEAYDSAPPSGSFARLTGASYTATSAQTPLTVTATGFASRQFISGHSIALR